MNIKDFTHEWVYAFTLREKISRLEYYLSIASDSGEAFHDDLWKDWESWSDPDYYKRDSLIEYEEQKLRETSEFLAHFQNPQKTLSKLRKKYNSLELLKFPTISTMLRHENTNIGDKERLTKIFKLLVKVCPSLEMNDKLFRCVFMTYKENEQKMYWYEMLEKTHEDSLIANCVVQFFDITKSQRIKTA